MTTIYTPSAGHSERRWNRVVLFVSRPPGGAPSLHDHLKGATDANKEHWETCQRSRTGRQDFQRNGIGIIVSHTDHDLKAHAAMLRNRPIHRAI